MKAVAKTETNNSIHRTSKIGAALVFAAGDAGR